MPQYHLIVAVDTDSNGRVTAAAVDYDLSGSSAHFPYGNRFDGADADKELMAQWSTVTSAAYAAGPDDPRADTTYDTVVEYVELLLAGGEPLPRHDCLCRGRIVDAFTDTDHAKVVQYACGDTAVRPPHAGWEIDPTNAPRTRPEEG